MATVVLNFAGGPRDGGVLRISDKTLLSGEYVTRQIPVGSPSFWQQHLYQSQETWTAGQTQITLYHLGVVNSPRVPR